MKPTEKENFESKTDLPTRVREVAVRLGRVARCKNSSATTETTQSVHNTGSRTVLFPLMGTEIGMEIIYFHSEK